MQTMTDQNKICFMNVEGIAKLIRDRDVSVEEVVQAHIQQIEKLNPVVNAVVTFIPEEALAKAKWMDKQLKDGITPGPFFGIPVLFKDLTHTAGIRTTFGSPIFKDFVPSADSIIVERLRKAGAICLGKTNTPEFGAGSQTFNKVFGATNNPYDLAKTCGGSSGGSAAALACGFSPIADGTDFGGSLRNPASFCNVVGFRPSSGRVPVWPKESGWFSLSVAGPMGRTVSDVALMLSVISGADQRDPLSLDSNINKEMADLLNNDFGGTKVAWSPTLGQLPVETEVLELIDSQQVTFENMGCHVEKATPDLEDADEIFEVLRAWHYDVCFGEMMETKKNLMKDTVVWNIEEGKKLSGSDLGRIEKKRTKLYSRMISFFSKFDYLVAPVVQVLPFSVDLPYVTKINHVELETYIEWMRSCYRISVTGLPSISVPCGFSKSGLPVGIQIIGGYRKDFEVLQLANAFEERTKVWRNRPSIA